MYGLNYKIRVAVHMWKPSSVKYAGYDEDMSDAKGGSKFIGSNQYVTGKAP